MSIVKKMMVVVTIDNAESRSEEMFGGQRSIQFLHSPTTLYIPQRERLEREHHMYFTPSSQPGWKQEHVIIVFSYSYVHIQCTCISVCTLCM